MAKLAGFILIYIDPLDTLTPKFRQIQYDYIQEVETRGENIEGGVFEDHYENTCLKGKFIRRHKFCRYRTG